MWLALAFVSATLLGFYDSSKKAALNGNAVLPVLLLNTLFSTLIFSPFMLDNLIGHGWFEGTFFEEEMPVDLAQAHIFVIIKAFIVLTSWIFGYFGLKNLPITIVGPINATRPIIVLVGAMLLFGERLNAFQWAGVLLAMISLFMLSRSSKKENVDFTHNKWIICVAFATLVGAISGLYDKYIMTKLPPIFVQSWFNFYQLIIMSVIVGLLWYPHRKKSTPFHWSWAIPLISIFICCADFAYFSALEKPESMISVVSLVRRGSVIISFLCGALIFKEKNLRSKALDLLFILLGMLMLWLGSR